MSHNSSILNLKAAFLAIVMVVWGLAEFSIHTFRPDTIQREDRIVSAFKNTADAIWQTHAQLQIVTTRITAQVRNLTENPDMPDTSDITTGLNRIMQAASPNAQWIILRNGLAVWWSQALDPDLVDEITRLKSVLYSNDHGVYVMSSSSFHSGSNTWTISSAKKIFEIANVDSKYGDVYQASAPALKSMSPTPFYLEGRLDLLPFDHRFSLIRLHDDATTGHLALSTLDPEVRNYINPVISYSIRTLFIIVVLVLLRQIAGIIITDHNAWWIIFDKSLFLIFLGWVLLKLGIIEFWTELLVLGPIQTDITSHSIIINYIWLTITFIPITALLYRKLTIDRFYNHSTYLNRSSLIIFLTGTAFGGVYFFLSEFLGYMTIHRLMDINTSSLIVPYPYSMLHIFFSAFVSALLMITVAVVLFLLRSVKYHIRWTLSLLIAGYTYSYTLLILIFLYDLQNVPADSVWVAVSFVAILGIVRWSHLNIRDGEVLSIVRAGVMLSFFLCLLSAPSVILNLQGGQINITQLAAGLLKYAILWSAMGALMWALFNSIAGRPLDLVKKGAFISGKADYPILTSILVVVLLHGLIFKFLGDEIKSGVENDFRTELDRGPDFIDDNMGFYALNSSGLPVWTSTLQPADTTEPAVLDHGIYSRVIHDGTDYILNWQKKGSETVLTAYWPGHGAPDRSVPIFSQTNTSFTRIFDVRFSNTIGAAIIILLFLNIALILSSTLRRSI